MKKMITKMIKKKYHVQKQFTESPIINPNMMKSEHQHVRIRKAIPPCLRWEAFGMPSRSDSSRRLLCIIM